MEITLGPAAARVTKTNPAKILWGLGGLGVERQVQGRALLLKGTVAWESLYQWEP